MPNEFVVRNGLFVSGSTLVSGTITATGGFIGSLQGTASFASSASWAPPQIDYDPFGRSMRVAIVENDFVQTILPFTTGVNQGGAVTSIAGDGSRPGIVRLETGMFISSRTMVWAAAANSSAVRFGQGYEWRYKAILNMSSSLIPSGAVSEIQIGFLDAGGTSITDGAAFIYRPSTITPTLQTQTRNNGSETLIPTAIPLQTNIWNSYEIRVNAAGTTASFFYNDTFIAHHTSSIPTQSGRETAFGVQLLANGAGVPVNNTSLDLDYLGAAAIMPTSR